MSVPSEKAAAASDEIAKLGRRLDRERNAREQAEAIAEKGLRELYSRQQELQLLEKVAVVANESPSLEVALRLAVPAVCEFTGWIMGQGYRCEETPDGMRLLQASAWHAANPERVREFRQGSEELTHGPAAGLPGRVLRSGGPVCIVEVGKDPDFPRAEAAVAAGIKMGVAFPVLVRSEVVAVLEFFSDKAREPDEALLKVMSQIGTQMGRLVERQRAEDRRLAYMAHHDALTDLANRVLFRERLEQALARVRRGDRIAVHCLDLDRFKAVNDTLGHQAGDMLLRQVAQRMRGCLHESDTVARLGGDEFAVIQVPANSPDDAAVLAARLHEALSAPYDLDGTPATIDVSIGISMAPNDAIIAEQLLGNADIALYRAKADGRGRCRFFEPRMNAEIRARREIERDLQRAIVEGHLELHYQPIVDLVHDRIKSCEALVRWRHPERGLIPPDQFIPIAEETGLMVDLGRWVLRQACADAAEWPDGIAVAVNVSPSQMTSQSLIPTVLTALARSGLPPERLEIEITETVLMRDTEATLATLHGLRDLGVRISIDDFGTGYSSLSYLRSFPFDKIKIDRSFISGLPDEKDALAIVQAVTGLASSLEVRTTAEGVETQDQLNKVRALGCTEMQGYLFSPPKPIAELWRLFDSRRAQAPSRKIGAAAAG